MRQPRWTTADLAEYEVTYLNGGEGGIRTPDTLSGMAAFEAARFNRSRTSPRQKLVAICLEAEFRSDFHSSSRSVIRYSLPSLLVRKNSRIS